MQYSLFWGLHYLIPIQLLQLFVCVVYIFPHLSLTYQHLYTFFLYCFLDGLGLSVPLFCYSDGQSVCLKWMCDRCDRLFIVANIIEWVCFSYLLKMFLLLFLFLPFFDFFFYKSNLSHLWLITYTYFFLN